MTVYWPGVILCLVAVAAGLVVWWLLRPAEEIPADDVKTMILLRHGENFYEVDDIWDAILVARILDRLDQERDAA